MDILVISDYKEDYDKALNLINKESKNDPPKEPYRSLHAAKELLLGMQENLEIALASILAAEAEDGIEAFTYKVLLAYVQKDLGHIYAKTEEPTLGEKYLRRSIELIEPHKMQLEAVIPYIGALNELGNVLANTKKSQEALEWLKLSEKVYNEFKAIENTVVILITELFGTPEEFKKDKGSDPLEKLYTQCTFYLAIVYGKLKEWEKSAMYYHNTLRRQLDSNAYKQMDFALTAVSLSHCFLNRNMFKEARYYLAVASSMMAEYEAKMITPEMSESTIDDMKKTLKRPYADLARCWANYGLTLLNASKERFSPKKDAKSVNDITENVSRINVDSNEFRFSNFQLEIYENSVSTEFCLNLDDAKLMFQFVVNWLVKAKSHYNLDTGPTEYAGIIKDYAKLYDNMVFFEENPVNKVKMLKRCAKYNEELIDALNPTKYLDICRDCWYGASITYCAILEIFFSQKNPSPSLLDKINQVCQKAIKNFLELQKSFMENDCITCKPNLSSKEIHAVLHSHFYLGSLYYNMVAPNPASQLENFINSYKYMKRFIDGCDQNKEAAETLKEEIRISKEFVADLPHKIEICRVFIK